MFRFKGTINRPNTKTQSWYIHTVHTLWDPILCTKHSPHTFRQCTHCGIPYCVQNTVLVRSDSAHTVGSHIVYKTQSWYIQTVHTLWDPILCTKHSPGTFRQCTHCGIPYCVQNTVLIHSDSAHTVGSHIVYKTQSWYIQTVHTLWDPILFADCIDIKVHAQTVVQYI